MDVSYLTQSASVSPGMLSHTSAETGLDTTSGQTSPLSAPSTDTLSITQSNIAVARLIMTQQVDIALNINSATSVNPVLDSDSEHHVDNMVNKVLNKIHDEGHSNHHHESDEEHHAKTVKSVQLSVNQGFEQSVLVMNQLNIMDSSVASDVAQTQSQVNRAIDQVSMSTSAMSLNSAGATRELSTSLQVTTQDGDVVTIDLSRSQSLAAGSFQDANGSVVYASSASETQLNISIQGDLSEKESRSIRQVIESVNKLAEKLFNGETGDAMEKLGELDINTKQLSSLALSMSSNISYQAVSAYTQVSQMTVSSTPLNTSPVNSIQPSSSVSTSTASPGSSSSTNTVADSTVPAINQAPTQFTKPASMVAVDVAVDASELLQQASLSNSFDNPTMEVEKLFDQLTELLSFEHGHRSNRAQHFVKDLFHDLVQQLTKDDDD